MSANNIPKKSRGKLNSVSVARSWLKLGILPVPLYPGSKRPRGGKEWNALRVEHDTVPHFFKSGDNVGGLWGEPSNWIVDVDLDCPEAVELAVHLLPETFVYGRRNRPASHYLYRCEGAPTYKRKDEEGSVIIEVRSTGSQSVLPPSIHDEDKDRYEINHDVEFTTIGRKALEHLVNQLAAGTILLRNYPESGGRHDFIHAMTGALLWSNWKPKAVRQFVEAFLAALGPRENDLDQRRRTMENTIENYDKGNRIQGWKSLSEWLPGKGLELAKTWMTKAVEQQIVPKKAPEDDTTDSSALNPELLNVPGLVGDIAKWSANVSQLKQPIFDLAVGLMATAFASSNKYLIEGWDTPLQPYFMLLAPTAAGKDSALDNVYRLAKRIELHEYAFQGFQSYHSLLDKLGNAPNMACWLWDEAARKLKSASRSPNSPDFQVMTWLLQMYGRANSDAPGVPGRNQAISAIEHPFLTVMATAQPAQLMEAITESDLATGLINRFILFDVGEGFPDANLSRSTVFPSRIEEQLRLMKRVETPASGFVRIKFEDGRVVGRFRDFDVEARKHAHEGGGGEMWGRANQNALILAGIVAVGIHPRAPRITATIAEWAIEIVRWSSRNWSERVNQTGSRSFVEKRSKTIEKYVREARSYIARARTPKLSKLITRGLMPKSTLTSLCRHISLKDLEDTLNHLTVSDILATGEVEGIEVVWIKSEKR